MEFGGGFLKYHAAVDFPRGPGCGCFISSSRCFWSRVSGESDTVSLIAPLPVRFHQGLEASLWHQGSVAAAGLSLRGLSGTGLCDVPSLPGSLCKGS